MLSKRISLVRHVLNAGLSSESKDDFWQRALLYGKISLVHVPVYTQVFLVSISQLLLKNILSRKICSTMHPVDAGLSGVNKI